MRSEIVALLVAVAAGGPAPLPSPSPRERGEGANHSTPTSTSTSTFLPADPDHAWSFPRDHFTRPGHRNEWWYFTGLLTGAGGRRLGFQVTFFKVGLLPAAPAFASAWSTAGVVMAHAAVSEVEGGRHRFAEVLWRDTPLLAGFGAAPGPLVAWAQAPPGTPGRWTLELAEGAWRLRARDDGAGLALELAAEPRAPVLLQGPNGYSRKAAAPGYASEYYSQPRLSVTGAVTLDGREEVVRGEAWLDREVGSSLLAPGQVGWDWFALRLAGGRDLMLYLLRRADGAVDFASGTLASPGRPPQALGMGDFRVTAAGRWRGAGGASYPAGWRIEIPSAGLDLSVAPLVAGAENRSRLLPGLAYWEGPVAVRAAGADAGEGYVELTGYGPGGRLPL